MIVHEHVSLLADIMQRVKDAIAMLHSELVAKGRPPRLMVDSRYYVPSITPQEADMVAEHCKQAFPPGIRIAVLLGEVDRVSPVQPIMDALLSAGIELRRFPASAMADAEAWLLAEGAEPDAAPGAH